MNGHGNGHVAPTHPHATLAHTRALSGTHTIYIVVYVHADGALFYLVLHN
jgi:hypothetical protein